MAYEKFVPSSTPTRRPRVTIRPTGLISFDAEAVETFGLKEKSHVVLFFDKTKKALGIKPASGAGEEGAIPLSIRRRSINVKAPQFFEHFGIAVDAPRRFDLGYDKASGMMVVDLRSIRRKRGRRPGSGSGRRAGAARSQ